MDEKDTGKTTPDIIETVVGEHELKLEKETDKGRFKHKRKILIAHNRVLPLHIKDFEMPERAKIITDPLGARIYLDEKDTGKVTPDVVYIEAGEHDLKLIKTTGKGNYVYKSKIISVSNRKITLRITDFETPASRHEKTKKKLVVDIQRVIDDGRLNRVTGIKLRTIFVLNNFNDANRYDKLDAAITKRGDTKGRVKVALEKESLVYYIDGKRVNKVIDIPINIEDLEKENLETFKKKTIDIIADEVLRKKGF